MIRKLRNSPAAAVIFASTLVAVMGVSLISPALPAVQEAWNISESQASLLLSAFTLPRDLSHPPHWTADRSHRSETDSDSGAHRLWAQWRQHHLRLRFHPDSRVASNSGAASSAIAMLTVTLLGDLYSGEQRRVLIGTNAAILAVGAAGYPLLGGALQHSHGRLHSPVFSLRWSWLYPA